MARDTEVDVGAKFRKRDAPDCVLEVVELFMPNYGARRHAYTRVSIAQHDLGVRLYSVSALTDRRLFTPLGGEGNGAR